MIDDHYWQVRAEAVPAEEVDPPSHSRRIHVYHFSSQHSNTVSRTIEPILWSSVASTVAAELLLIPTMQQLCGQEQAPLLQRCIICPCVSLTCCVPAL